NLIEYISPSGIRKESSGQKETDATFALKSTGAFSAGKRDADYQSVVTTSRKIDNLPWILLSSVNEKSALKETSKRSLWFSISLVLILLLFAAAFFAVWSYGSSKRAVAIASEYHKLSSKYRNQKNLLELVANSQPESVYIIDTDHKYRFANTESGM